MAAAVADPTQSKSDQLLTLELIPWQLVMAAREGLVSYSKTDITDNRHRLMEYRLGCLSLLMAEEVEATSLTTDLTEIAVAEQVDRVRLTQVAETDFSDFQAEVQIRPGLMHRVAVAERPLLAKCQHQSLLVETAVMVLRRREASTLLRVAAAAQATPEVLRPAEQAGPERAEPAETLVAVVAMQLRIREAVVVAGRAEALMVAMADRALRSSITHTRRLKASVADFKRKFNI